MIQLIIIIAALMVISALVALRYSKRWGYGRYWYWRSHKKWVSIPVVIFGILISAYLILLLLGIIEPDDLI